MKKKFLDRRIPSIVGLFFLAAFLIATVWFGENYTQFLSRASGGDIPKNIQISNITDTSFTVSYTTDERINGMIIYGLNISMGQVALDDREQTTKKSSEHRTHYFTISDLIPGTKYYFAIQSGGKNFLNNKQPYEATTLVSENSLFETTLNKVSVSGNVNLPDGSVPIEGIAYLSEITGQLISSVFRQDGTYKLEPPVKPNTVLTIVLTNGLEVSHVSVAAANSNSIPVVTLSKDYDFIASSSGILQQAMKVDFPLFSSKIASSPGIFTPKNAEKFIDAQPVFKGTALPKAVVNVTIESEQKIQTSIEADNQGNWQFRPGVPLDPGQHIITIVTRDVSGIERIFKRSFTVFAAGSQFTEPSISPTIAATPTPTGGVTPTLAPASPTPTLTLVPTVSLRPTTTPITPGSSSLFLGATLTMLLITGGFMLFFFL